MLNINLLKRLRKDLDHGLAAYSPQKPSVIIIMHYMQLGGAESALLGMLQSIDPAKMDTDVFIYAHKGELMRYVYEGSRAKRFNLLPETEAYAMLEEPISLLIKKGYWRLALCRLWGRWEEHQYQKNNTKGLDNYSNTTFQQHRTIKVLPKINPDKEYNLAISFMTPHYVVLDKVCAKKKMGWIHTDYANVFINQELELRMWERLDIISSISSDVSSSFIEVFPSLKKKIFEIENILSPKFIRERSRESCPVFESETCLKLLTIGRYSYQKKMEDIPYLCRKLLQCKDYYLKWYIIGYGSSEYEHIIREKIKEEGMEDHVILLGKQSNPYPYIRTCDIYVQPSRYEGKSITVREAQILNKPVVVTNYPTAPSQIQNEIDGVIVPMEIEECASAIITFIKDKQMQESIVKYLSCHDYGNEREIEKIYDLL